MPENSAKSQEPRAKSQEPRAKSQEPQSYRMIIFILQKIFDTLGDFARIMGTLGTSLDRPRRFPCDISGFNPKDITMQTKTVASSTVMKHKTGGNQAPEQFNLEVCLIECAKQLGDYAHADAKIASGKLAQAKAKEALNKLIPRLHKQGVKLGDLPRKGKEDLYANSKLTPSQVLTVGMYKAMMQTGDISHDTAKNYLSAFRGCVADNRAFSLNPSRAKVKGNKPAGNKPAGNTKAAKPADTKAGEVKQSLADVIKANFITLLKNNPQVAAELLDQLAELLDA